MSLTLIVLWSSALVFVIITLTADSAVTDHDDEDTDPKPPIHSSSARVKVLREGYATGLFRMYHSRDRPSASES